MGVRALGTAQRWAHRTAKGLYILSKSIGDRHSRSHSSRRLWGKCHFGIKPPGPAAVCGCPPSGTHARQPCAPAPWPRRDWGASSAPPSSSPGPHTSIFCPCPAQGLLRGLNPGPGGQGAGLVVSLWHVSLGAQACAACQPRGPQACHLLGDGLRGLSLSRNFSSGYRRKARRASEIRKGKREESRSPEVWARPPAVPRPAGTSQRAAAVVRGSAWPWEARPGQWRPRRVVPVPTAAAWAVPPS